MTKKTMKILIVDDEKSIIDLIRLWMGEKGHDIDIAFDGGKALEFIERNQYDLVIMDHNMPEVTGLELVRHVKKKSPGTKMIMMTGYPFMAKFAAKEVGVDEYLTKPFKMQEMMDLIEKCERE